jgi:membrane protein implicated in regulation of membrane protease activity
LTDLTRYLLMQAIGWVVVAVAVAALVIGIGLPGWLWWAVPLAAAKDLLLLPAVRRGWGPPKVGPASLVGARGEATEPFGDSGHVRVRGELWAARLREPGVEIPRGGAVIVREVRGLTLIVEAASLARRPEEGGLPRT